MWPAQVHVYGSTHLGASWMDERLRNAARGIRRTRLNLEETRDTRGETTNTHVVSSNSVYFYSKRFLYIVANLSEVKVNKQTNNRLYSLTWEQNTIYKYRWGSHDRPSKDTGDMHREQGRVTSQLVWRRRRVERGTYLESPVPHFTRSHLNKQQPRQWKHASFVSG